MKGKIYTCAVHSVQCTHVQCTLETHVLYTHKQMPKYIRTNKFDTNEFEDTFENGSWLPF